MKRLWPVLTAVLLTAGPLLSWNLFLGRDPFPAFRRFQVTYALHLPGVSKEAGKIRMWVPLASGGEGQRILERKVVADIPYQVTRDSHYGNEMAYFEIGEPFRDPLEVKIIYSVEIARAFFEQEDGEKNLGKYLKSSRRMGANQAVRTRTRDAIHGKNRLIEKVKGIYESVIRHMSYDKTVPGWGRGDTIRACLLGKGNCTDFHSLFISMAHAAEIPARFKIGLTIPDESEGEIPGYHCWAEFYEEGKGWRPVDASQAWKHPERKEAYFGNFDTNKFLISVGRDIDLVPKQEGPPVNIFFYPYVEVDGKEWNGVKTSFQFKNVKDQTVIARSGATKQSQKRDRHVSFGDSR